MTNPAAPTRDGAQPSGPVFGDPAAIDAAHREIRADPSIQFDLPWFKPEVNPPPAWLKSLVDGLGNFVQWVGGGWTVLMWIAIALAVAALLLAFYAPLRDWIRARLARDPVVAAPRWAPEAAVAGALLDDADALAARGDYGAAVRLILHRSIEDIERWRGDRLRPSLTSRDIARFDALPDAARSIFARIVADVERSLFAGGTLSRADWDRARADYAGFALGRG